MNITIIPNVGKGADPDVGDTINWMGVLGDIHGG
jgi:hypothetical protein